MEKILTDANKGLEMRSSWITKAALGRNDERKAQGDWTGRAGSSVTMKVEMGVMRSLV